MLLWCAQVENHFGVEGASRIRQSMTDIAALAIADPSQLQRVIHEAYRVLRYVRMSCMWIYEDITIAEPCCCVTLLASIFKM